MLILWRRTTRGTRRKRRRRYRLIVKSGFLPRIQMGYHVQLRGHTTGTRSSSFLTKSLLTRTFRRSMPFTATGIAYIILRPCRFFLFTFPLAFLTVPSTIFLLVVILRTIRSDVSLLVTCVTYEFLHVLFAGRGKGRRRRLGRSRHSSSFIGFD